MKRIRNKFIFLGYNLIETIEINSFYNLSKIQRISLRNNFIKTVEDFSFHFLNFKVSIDLFANSNMSKIYENSLSNIFSCHFTYESSISFEYINFSFFQMKQLDLSENNIKTTIGNTIKGTFSNRQTDGRKYTRQDRNLRINPLP